MVSNNLCCFCNKTLSPTQDLNPIQIAPHIYIWPWSRCCYTIKVNYKDKNGIYKNLELCACGNLICYYCIKERGRYCNNHLGNMVQPWCEE